MPAKKVGGSDGYLPRYAVDGLINQLELWSQDKADERSAFLEIPIGSESDLPKFNFDFEPGSVSLQMTTRGIKKFTITAGEW